jgi:hypothetical protein
VLVIAGIFLALWGYNIYDSASSQFNRALSGDTPIKAWARMAGGDYLRVNWYHKVKVNLLWLNT